jgi:glycosyltransferase involved in cell wall biosynthesis
MNFDVLTFGVANLDLPFPQVSMGYCTDENEMRLIYSAADVYAFPSKEDNSPLTVSEAMACGTPVISFNVGNIPELISHRDNGYIARNFDVADFAEGLSWFYSSDATERLRRGLKAVESVRKNNDPLSSAQQHVDVYRKALRL